MTDELQQVNVLVEPGIYKVSTASTTVYYVDTTDGARLMMRARGSGPTGQSEHDDLWLELTELTSGPVTEPVGSADDPRAEEMVTWWLRVGARHGYDFRALSATGELTDNWWWQRTCERIERLEARP